MSECNIGILVMASDFSLWRQIVDVATCSLLVDPLNPKKIADVMLLILKHPNEAEAMEKRGKRAVEDKYNWDI